MAVLVLKCLLVILLLDTASAWCLDRMMCGGRGSLSSRIKQNLQINDANGDSRVTAQEMFIDMAMNYDTDNDGCVSKKEWMKRWLGFYRFSSEVAAAVYPGDDSCCGLNLVEFTEDPANAEMPTAGLASFLIGTVASTCSKIPGLFTSNCDCMQLKDTCEFYDQFKSDPACRRVLACEGRGTLEDRFLRNLRNNDQNGDGIIVEEEFMTDTIENYDKNRNGCVDPEEWMNVWTKTFKFSEEYARERFIRVQGGRGNDSCAIDVNAFRGVQLDVPGFLERNVQTLIDVCHDDPRLMSSLCDCLQLEDMCQNAEDFRDLVACRTFVACKDKGSLEQRFLRNLRNNDQNGDGVITSEEFIRDTTDNYDKNKNGCVDTEEWIDVWTKVFNFSEEYATERFNQLEGGRGNDSCAVDINIFRGLELDVPSFLEADVQTLVGVCQDDPNLMGSLCDCLQLPDMCQNAEDFKDLVACTNFVQTLK